MASPLEASLAALAAQIAAAGRDEARLQAEWIAAHLLRVNRLDLAAGRHGPWTTRLAAEASARAERVAAGEPLQYVLGTAVFHGREFLCDRRALVPRPETEELVQAVLDDAEAWRAARPAVADVGTGTGCIAVTLAAERPAARVLAIERSEDALALARANANRLSVAARIDFAHGDLLAGVAAGSLDVVVSNPPYIASREIEGLDPVVRDHEPRLALDGGADGLDLIRRLVPQALASLREGGRFWLEIGEEQGGAVRRLLADAGFRASGVRRDLSGRERMAWAQR